MKTNETSTYKTNQSKIYYSIPTFLNVVIIFFSTTVNILWYFPVLEKLKKLELIGSYISILLFVFYLIFIIAVFDVVTRLITSSIKKEITKQRKIAVNEFVNYLYDSEDFKTNVLLKEVALYNSNHKKIGITTAGSKLTDEQNKFINTIQLS